MRCALAIGGVDPGGGAGVAADLRAFARGGVFGAAAVAVVTVQSTGGLRSVRALAAREVVAQAAEVIAHQDVRAIKTGALGSAANVRGVAALRFDGPIVVDTVMLPTRGKARLLDAGALRALCTQLIPRATLVTSNVAETETLLGARVRTAAEARAAAEALHARHGAAFLVKGGHLTGRDAVDFLATKRGVVELSSPRVKLAKPLHGAGCHLASLIAARLARGSSLVTACRWSKRTHHEAIERARSVGGPLLVLF